MSRDRQISAVHATVETCRGLAALRDLAPADLDAIVGYLHDTTDEHLNSLIDRARLGAPEDTRRRIRGAIRTGDPDQNAVAFVVTVNDKLAGFTLLARHTPEINYSHWHVIDQHLRAGGISTALYPDRIKLYFDLFPIDRLIHQTKTSNVGVNRMLDKFVAVAETRYVERPDGAGSAGEFHLRYVFRHDVPRFFDIAKHLR